MNNLIDLTGEDSDDDQANAKDQVSLSQELSVVYRPNHQLTHTRTFLYLQIVRNATF